MQLLVTGGAGFIGSNYVRWLLANTDDTVVVLDALTYAGNLDNFRGIGDDPRFRFVKGDIRDRDAVRAAMTGCDRVVHFAAETHVDRSIVDPDSFVLTNCQGTNVIMDTARQLDVERVLHISTDEVYGSVEHGSSVETDPLEPRSPYSAAKAGSDLIALSYGTTYGLDVVLTRASNNYGPYQFPEKVIPLFVTNLLDGHKVPLYGDGLNVRDWLYVADHCSGVDAVLRRGQRGEIYNIGGGNEVANRELTDRLIALCGRDESAIEYVADRLGHDRRYSVDCSKLRALGWQPERDFEAGLVETVAWYRDNRWWWEPLKARAAIVAR
ncbi:MAG: dTDP-glucose 4,6-dehydratase [Acidimicrobiales bacterium]|nr:dTDP-glucose 4,6-dehydratase [Acidimicrobiales bacterium]